MTRVVGLGAGIAGHTAAAFARRWLGREHTVTVVEIHPKGERDDPSPYAVAEAADGTRSNVRTDFLINATGPALRFDRSEGLGPEGGAPSSPRGLPPPIPG